MQLTTLRPGTTPSSLDAWRCLQAYVTYDNKANPNFTVLDVEVQDYPGVRYSVLLISTSVLLRLCRVHLPAGSTPEPAMQARACKADSSQDYSSLSIMLAP
jgi:hypothetical protein